ncbi:hypothetical protein IE53DRAFT_200085 [Violaceomyces palustris]|uniref:Uncharacterized protein n=1 Tax=Violaceomyces palustris TaxID=1673888 RepID=A0ACD0NRC9_9BASI|nr:hypothetical protein IE53DRAFT_200085 [Violaceomyces palustris]
MKASSLSSKTLVLLLALVLLGGFQLSEVPVSAWRGSPIFPEPFIRDRNESLQGVGQSIKVRLGRVEYMLFKGGEDGLPEADLHLYSNLDGMEHHGGYVKTVTFGRFPQRDDIFNQEGRDQLEINLDIDTVKYHIHTPSPLQIIRHFNRDRMLLGIKFSFDGIRNDIYLKPSQNPEYAHEIIEAAIHLPPAPPPAFFVF